MRSKTVCRNVNNRSFLSIGVAMRRFCYVAPVGGRQPADVVPVVLSYISRIKNYPVITVATVKVFPMPVRSAAIRTLNLLAAEHSALKKLYPNCFQQHEFFALIVTASAAKMPGSKHCKPFIAARLIF